MVKKKNMEWNGNEGRELLMMIIHSFGCKVCSFALQTPILAKFASVLSSKMLKNSPTMNN